MVVSNCMIVSGVPECDFRCLMLIMAHPGILSCCPWSWYKCGRRRQYPRIGCCRPQIMHTIRGRENQLCQNFWQFREPPPFPLMQFEDSGGLVAARLWQHQVPHLGWSRYQHNVQRYDLLWTRIFTRFMDWGYMGRNFSILWIWYSRLQEGPSSQGLQPISPKLDKMGPTLRP